jgi:hypothetical protein
MKSAPFDDRARRKLKAATRAHAVARCIMGGLVWGPRAGWY